MEMTLLNKSLNESEMIYLEWEKRTFIKIENRPQRVHNEFIFIAL